MRLHRPFITALSLTSTLLLTACPAPQTLPAPDYPTKSTISLANSPRCSGGRCTCRGVTDEAEQGIPAGRKRFELRLPRSTSQIWVEVAGQGVYYKEAEKVDPHCVYVDLAPGQHQITIHAVGGDPEVGLQSGLTVHEYAKPEGLGPHWYRSFHFACGHAASPCTDEELQSWVRTQRQLPRGVLDPCGSVRALGARTGGSRTRKNDAVYRDLTLAFTLKVYRFAPYRRPGSPKCKGPSKNR